MSGKLHGCVCLVTGATRGIGKGIAMELGQAGAIVYITGRTLKSDGKNVEGSLEETAETINNSNSGGVSSQFE
ncbi:putative short chain dehydrogenase [Schistosoma mansoni]|uniref:putative short chain dehydrogenase n=1 Tax=Schistosoma mansoni TaxID=6183 RepID=UPI00022DCBC8|nr:putative short chain dehydrogenase [Schistosoma mansoni]|eukprot:XP_018654254.1 putative short chain dehydrogenase [Schistosoma mansoni]